MSGVGPYLTGKGPGCYPRSLTDASSQAGLVEFAALLQRGHRGGEYSPGSSRRNWPV